MKKVKWILTKANEKYPNYYKTSTNLPATTALLPVYTRYLGTASRRDRMGGPLWLLVDDTTPEVNEYGEVAP